MVRFRAPQAMSSPFSSVTDEPVPLSVVPCEPGPSQESLGPRR